MPDLQRGPETSASNSVVEPDSGSETSLLPGWEQTVIGRQAEMAWLERHLRDAAGGLPRALLVCGEAGIGKTHLLRALGRSAPRHAAAYCYSRCYEDFAVPYQPFVDGLLSQFGATLDDPALARAIDVDVLRRLLRPDAADTTAAPPTALPPAAEGKLRLFRAAAEFVLHLGRRQPLLVIIDDLHWADRGSLELLSYLVFALSDAARHDAVPVLLLCAHRPVEPATPLGHVLAALRREDICRPLDLTGLEDAEIGELVRRMRLGRPAPSLTSAIAAATRGNPLFIQEAVRHLVERGTLQERGGELVAEVSVTDLRFPQEVTGAIAARAQGLSASCRRVLTIAAFLTGRLSTHLLGALAETGDNTLADLIDEAVQQRLLLRDGDALQFAHPLIAQVFLQQIDAAEGRRLHARIARILQAVSAAAPDEHLLQIAHHLIAAGDAADPVSRIAYARRAADHAFGIFAWSAAAAFCEAALAAAPPDSRLLSASTRAHLHYQAGLAHYRSMDVDPCIAHYERAADAFGEADDVRGLAEVLMEHARARYSLAAVPYGSLIDVRSLEDALARLGETEPALRGRICAILAEVYCHAKQPLQAEALARRAIALGDIAQDETLSTHGRVALAWAQQLGMRVAECVGTYREALVSARRSSDLWVQGWPLSRLPHAHLWCGQLAEAEQAAREAAALTSRTGDWAEHSMALGALTAIAVARGDFEAAEEYARETVPMVRRSRYPWGGAEALSALACARMLRGAHLEAADALEILREPGQLFADPGPALQVVGWAYQELLRAHGHVGDAARTAVPTLAAIMCEAGTDLAALTGLCAVLEIADLISAPELIDRPYAILSQAAAHGVVFSGGWLFLLPRVLGAAAAGRGSLDEADAHFRSAAAAATHAGAQPELGRTLLHHARMLWQRRRRADLDRAPELLVHAYRIFVALGMHPFAAQAQRLAASMPDKPFVTSLEHAPPAAAALNVRDVQVLERLARGYSDEEAAADLVLSRATVADYRNRIREQTGIADAPGADTYLRERHLGRVGRPAAAPDAATPARQTLPPVQPTVILFTDMVAYTALIERLGDAKAQAVLRMHNAIIRRCLSRHGGREQKHTGDGVMAAFSSAAAAIRCALEIQDGLAEHNRAHPATAIHVRIGLNAGQPIAEEGQLFGASVNAAARICAQAEPGQILVSDVVRMLAGTPFRFDDRGEVALKGFSERFRIFAAHTPISERQAEPAATAPRDAP